VSSRKMKGGAVMANGEGFSIKKLLLSPFTGLYWTKTLMFSGGALVILIIVLSIYKTYFKRPEPVQTIRAESGSTVTVIQKNERKRVFIPFIEAFIEQPSSDDFQTGIRAGLRFEF